MREILPALHEWYAAGSPFGLATVVAVSRSAPRDPGAAMAVGPGDEVVGSVSGGCVEGAVFELAREVVASGEARLETFGYSDEDAFAVGLTCGGEITVLVRRVSPADDPAFAAVAESVAAGRPVTVATVIDGPAPRGATLAVWPDTEPEPGPAPASGTGVGATQDSGARASTTQDTDTASGTTQDTASGAGRGTGSAAGPDTAAGAGTVSGPGAAVTPGTAAVPGGGAATRSGAATAGAGGVAGSLGTTGLNVAVTADARGELALGATGQRHYGPHGERREDAVSVFLHSFAPPPRMLVFGAIDYAAAVARIGDFLGYRVTVCDARPVFATPKRFPPGVEVVVDWPHRYLGGTTTDARTVICVLTHDPKFDVPLLEEALRRPAAYIGAMGSRRTHDERMERLAEAGLTERELARLRSPVGLDLGARTPEEVAVSVAAEIVALRWGGTGTPLTATAGAIHPR
ncbi:XdhC family protein [Streptomyces sp. 142MFCol3.1]|uniref:XdhC family protein n=1 Tax=Streptomyces sp. 142MFCol3.1 TaxID=1172179 RepID=UPI0004034D76|nr:XdhC family protein [Streptomyces sp. 142MFCol3.1]